MRQIRKLCDRHKNLLLYLDMGVWTKPFWIVDTSHEVLGLQRSLCPCILVNMHFSLVVLCIWLITSCSIWTCFQFVLHFTLNLKCLVLWGCYIYSRYFMGKCPLSFPILKFNPPVPYWSFVGQFLRFDLVHILLFTYIYPIHQKAPIRAVYFNNISL